MDFVLHVFPFFLFKIAKELDHYVIIPVEKKKIKETLQFTQ